jgi:hypothetical protein
MDSRRHIQPPHGYASDPLELYWLSASLPDGLYVLPPDAAGQAEGQGERAAEMILVASIAIAVGLLVMIIALVAVVA